MTNVTGLMNFWERFLSLIVDNIVTSIIAICSAKMKGWNLGQGNTGSLPGNTQMIDSYIPH